MTAVTTYTCDNCGHQQDTSSQMWQVELRFRPYGSSNYSAITPYNDDWCRACMERFHLLKPLEKEKPVTTSKPKTTEHSWRWYDGMKHKECTKCGECRPRDWPDDGCIEHKSGEGMSTPVENIEAQNTMHLLAKELYLFVADKVSEYEVLRKVSIAEKEDQNSYGVGYDSGYLKAMRDVLDF